MTSSASISPTTAKSLDSTDTTVAFLKVNDHQYVELLSDRPEPLTRISLPTPRTSSATSASSPTTLEQMRLYLASKGIEVPARSQSHPHRRPCLLHQRPRRHPDRVLPTPARQRRSPGRWKIPLAHPHLRAHLPHRLPRREHSARSRLLRQHPRLPGDLARCLQSRPNSVGSTCAFPTGPTTSNSCSTALSPPPTAAATTSPSRSPTSPPPSPPSSPAPPSPPMASPSTSTLGNNGKRQVNLFDPDGTRVELMEPVTADGKPVPSSTAPPPPPAHP